MLSTQNLNGMQATPDPSMIHLVVQAAEEIGCAHYVHNLYSYYQKNPQAGIVAISALAIGIGRCTRRHCCIRTKSDGHAGGEETNPLSDDDSDESEDISPEKPT